jgi:hypothetical protein
MLLRFRWFTMGALASLGVFAYLANQIRRARDRLTPRNLADTGMRSMARILDNAAEAVAPGNEEDQ